MVDRTWTWPSNRMVDPTWIWDRMDDSTWIWNRMDDPTLTWNSVGRTSIGTAAGPSCFPRPVRGPGWPRVEATRPKREQPPVTGGCSVRNRQRPTLPGRIHPSTIGAAGLNFCVRNGNRCDPSAIATETVTETQLWRRSRRSVGDSIVNGPQLEDSIASTNTQARGFGE